MSWRGALQQYINHPEKYETVSGTESRVIYHDSVAVIITDGFPKATEHLLILPRNASLTKTHPTTALTDHIKHKLEPYIEIAIKYIIKDFKSKFEILDDKLTENFQRDFIQIGIHHVPSMNNLHIHVITKDFHSIRLKHKKHYNSFNTDFFVKWDDLPLKEKPSDPKLIEKQYLRDHDLICCYCGQNFTNKFSKLKQHLNEEFSKRFVPK